MATDRLIWILKVAALLTVTASSSFLLSNFKALQCCVSAVLPFPLTLNLITTKENTAHILPCHSAGFMTRSSEVKMVVILRSDGPN